MIITVRFADGTEFEKAIKNTICMIGSSPIFCDFILPDERVAERQCIIKVVDGDIYITNLSYNEGTYVDGIKIPSHKKVKVSPAQVISFPPVECVDIKIQESAKISSTPTRKSEGIKNSARRPTKAKNYFFYVGFIIFIFLIGWSKFKDK